MFSSITPGAGRLLIMVCRVQFEPTVMPARIPHLLVNGASGIAVGIATNIPPHNLREVVDGLCALIHDPEITVKQLMQHIPAPDFPTGQLPSQALRAPSASPHAMRSVLSSASVWLHHTVWSQVVRSWRQI